MNRRRGLFVAWGLALVSVLLALGSWTGHGTGPWGRGVVTSLAWTGLVLGLALVLIMIPGAPRSVTAAEADRRRPRAQTGLRLQRIQ